MGHLLHQLLRETAQRQPRARALSLPEGPLSYAEYDERSEQLASALREAECRPGDRVGILAGKTLPAYLGLQAALRAGAAYVPLDPAAPPRRLAYIARDCGIRLLVASRTQLPAVEKLLDAETALATVVVPDADASQVPVMKPRVVTRESLPASREGAVPPEPVGESDLAYVLYTSGSTGSPKGVMISHRNALSFVHWAQEALRVRSDDDVSGHAPLHFDLSIFDVFVTALAGATLHPVPPSTALFPVRLAEWIARSRISVWYSVPSVLSLLVRHGALDVHSFDRLRMVLFAGEVFPVKFLRAWMKKLPHADFFNLYGPTETNVVTWYRVPEVPAEDARAVPIGKACSNAEVFRIGENGAVVDEVGSEGELYARGPCVAVGYWGDPERTRQAFVADPRPGTAPGRAYKTGDLVTADLDGNLHYRGRRDHMVKSRGYRIELGEIEAAFYAHPGVREVAAIACPDEVIGNRIRAFVATDDAALTRPELERFAADRLPKYMLPEEIELRPELPKTSTGKIDRSALASGAESR